MDLCQHKRTMSSQLWYHAKVLAILLLAMLYSLRPAEALEIVVNRNVSTNQITHSELQAIFTMRIRAWSDGQPIRVFVLGDNAPEQIEFSKKLLDIFPYQLRRYWDRLVFSGTGQAPIELTSPGEMYNRVASTPGAIGYLPTEHIGNQVRIIKVSNP
ncbi:hypothetical protein ANRL3_00579 [Anaerolineae bacterium]|nr:hypothetical protein ANRL3_00579 [Anaerolineae bacterium]